MRALDCIRPSTKAALESGRPLVDGLEDDLTALATHDDFVLILGKPAGPGQADGLATAVTKQFGSFGHVESIDASIYTRNIPPALRNAFNRRLARWSRFSG
jgi:hypothetical protein